MTTSWPCVVAAATAGILVVGVSYRLSGSGSPAALYYPVFWAGMLIGAVPVTGRIATGTRPQAMWGLLLLGVLTHAPKFLRNPDAPSYHDEYAHWRQAVDVLSTGELLRPNAIIPIVQFYPGTSGLTAGVQRLSGLSTWSSGQLVLLVAHVLGLFAVFVLARTHLDTRAGAVASVVYALNPSAMYFDTQYAYEGIAIALFLWILALTSLGARARGRHRAGAVVGALLCAGACVVTHHLTTLFLALLLFVVALLVSVRGRITRRKPSPERADDGGTGVWWLVFGATTLFAGLWVAFVARPTVDYLSPYVGGSVDQLSAVAAKTGAGRQVLAPTVQPLWERGLTALAPVVVGLMCLALLGIMRREHRGWRTDTLALMAFGFVYFPSVLFLLAPSGAEGARRSWAFSYVGLALVAAFVVPRGRERVPRRWWARTPLLAAFFVVLLIGNVGGGLNDPYRFPGPFTWGTDTNSASAEARTVAEQLAAQAGPVRVVADRYTALQLVAYGGFGVAAPSTGFPAWELTQSPEDPDRKLAGDLHSSGYDYLVVDTRMADRPAFNGDNYGPGDPLLYAAPPRAHLDRLDRVPWAARIITTEHLRVYRLDLTLLGAKTGSGS
ncbi:hypothetical protein [Umezawaea sp. Da 62-37]|uniref:ArnT family glycosyltransferase n=1 Tax=Umezawaea sp. Da 62-37 TaxID=3075927 RepID=UPI0028F6DB1B|nr:hypothetical protein [Umezawaea sp. Da 62-37]WNV85108.1 hypothetical protein RM788_44365 [Umezawaea sp. Da 62-37]